VGHFLDLAAGAPGEVVLDLGSGSGMDSFLAALRVGPEGRVIGVDMTAEQLAKARRLAAEAGIAQVEFREGYIERPPVEDAAVDVVISNGVINLAPDKRAVFAAAARALRPGGRLALADIVTERQLPEGIRCDAALWAACIGGAMQRERYREAIEGPASRSTSSARTPPTGSSRSGPRAPAASTASRASRSWRDAGEQHSEGTAVGQHAPRVSWRA
jgi:arsenite methyltransferase